MDEQEYDEYIVAVGNNPKDVRIMLITMSIISGLTTYIFGRAIYKATVVSAKVEVVGKV